jgi:Tol biopolymer transport system component
MAQNAMIEGKPVNVFFLERRLVMNKLSIIAAFFALLFLAGQNALAQSGYDLFQKGLVKERTEGDLDEAIRLYKQIVADHKDDRALVAKTLVQMGGCYEKLGRAEARKTYEQVVREFTDQPEPVRVARQHLEQLDAGTPGTAVNGPTYRLVLDEKIAGMPVHTLVFSPSGDRIVFVSKKKMYIADRTGTVIRPILEDVGPWNYLVCLRWSPDGRLIAYRASRKVTSDPNTDSVHAIFALSPDGGAPRKIVPEQKQRIFSICWTPDSKGLTYASIDGIHTLTVDGSEVHFIPREDLPNNPWPWSMACSPNGRWLTFGVRKENAKDSSDMDVCILPASGGTIRRLTNLPGFNAGNDWAPDGRTLYFRSVTGQTHNIWKLAMDPETGSAKGEPQQVTFLDDTRIQFFQVIGDGSRIALKMDRRTTCIQVADASSPRESLTLARGRSPQLSPDGQTVYCVNNIPGEEGIYAVSRQRGTSRRLTQSLPGEGSHGHLPRFDLSPDGRTLTRQ